MPITYPLSFPSSVTVNALTITPRNSIGRSESPFSFQEQVYDYGGELWMVAGSLPLMEKQTAEEYAAFLLSLKGKWGTFLFPIPNATPQGVAAGTPVVKGGGQTGNTLLIDGLTTSTTNIFMAGDWINLGTGASTRAYKILTNCNSNASGEATLDIWPSLRSSPSDNQSVITSNCKILLRLKNDEGYSIDVNKLYFMQFDAMEAL